MDYRATIDAVLAGDEARFAEIVRSFDAPVRRIVRRMIHDVHALEDVIQEVWLRAYRQLSKLADVSRLESWLTTIARNCVRDHYRGCAHTVAHETLNDPVCREDASSWIWGHVADLTPELCRVLELRYREQLSYAEIAERIGTPLATVRGRLFLARQALRRELKSEEES